MANTHRQALANEPAPSAYVDRIIKEAKNRSKQEYKIKIILSKINDLAQDISQLRGTGSSCFTWGKNQKADFLNKIQNWGTQTLA